MRAGQVPTHSPGERRKIRGPDRGLRFAHDSLLEGAVRCELVSAAGPDTAPDEYLESIKKGGLLLSCNQNLFYMVSMFLPEGRDS
jgi:hypothetical protein